MLKFERLTEERLAEAAPYFAAQTTHIADFSLGFQFMWNKALATEYAIVARCLVLREWYAGKHYFHYPLSLTGDLAEEEAAVEALERDCRDTATRLHFTNVPRERLGALTARYADCAVNNRRRWRDYLYNAADFALYEGKRYAGQRNHVNKFVKSYPGWRFSAYTEADAPALLTFLRTYAERQMTKDSRIAKEEMEETLALVPRMRALGLFAGVLTAEDKIVGFSVGERCGDMVVVHIEKALREYDGAYPMLAQQFARMFRGDARYINRMDDAGDAGLRKSKLQYLPVSLVDKFKVLPHRIIDGIAHPPVIETERLVLREMGDGDEEAYYRLACDAERNRYWGYDWREDYPEGLPPKGYFSELVREDLRRKEEISLGIYHGEAFVGEAVLHRFGYRGEVELGVRLLPEAEGKGFAREAMRALADHALYKLDAERAEAKCFRENGRSARMLRAAGFCPCGEDERYFYFLRTAEV